MSDFELEKKEEAAEASEEIVEAVENAPEAPATEVIEEAPKKKAAVHMTASAAALNAEGEVDIRRRKPREVKEIKTSRISYEKKKGRLRGTLGCGRNLYVPYPPLSVPLVLLLQNRDGQRQRRSKDGGLRNDGPRYLYRMERLRKL